MLLVKKYIYRKVNRKYNTNIIHFLQFCVIIIANMVDIDLVTVSHSLHHMPVADPLVEHLMVQHSDQSTQSRLALVTAELEDTEASP